MQIALIPEEGLALVVPRVLPVLARALPHAGGRIRLEDLAGELMTQQRNLWVVFEPERDAFEPRGAFTTQIGIYPAKRVLRIDFLAGERLSEWIKEAEDKLLLYAAENDCSALEMVGRPGWQRTLEKLGWQLASVTLERPVPKTLAQVFREEELRKAG